MIWSWCSVIEREREGGLVGTNLLVKIAGATDKASRYNLFLRHISCKEFLLYLACTPLPQYIYMTAPCSGSTLQSIASHRPTMLVPLVGGTDLSNSRYQPHGVGTDHLRWGGTPHGWDRYQSDTMWTGCCSLLHTAAWALWLRESWRNTIKKKRDRPTIGTSLRRGRRCRWLSIHDFGVGGNGETSNQYLCELWCALGRCTCLVKGCQG
jgi:hypothetical protein